MKTVILIIITIVFLSFNIFSQTSAEEYNYVTKGYKVQVIDQGGDMKKGYELEDVDAAKTGIRSVSVKKLLRVNGGQKKIAAYMLVYQKESDPKEYICIPHPGSAKEVQDTFWESLYDGTVNSSEKLQLITFVLARQLKW